MLFGLADPEVLAARPGTATVPTFATDALVLPGVEVLQVLYEMRTPNRQEVLPPGLHPTNPPTISFVAWRCPDGPVGSFAAVQVRVGCRSGPRTRGFVVGTAFDGSSAARGELASRWGFRCLPAGITLTRGYDRVGLRVEVDGRPVLSVRGIDPDPLSATDLEYTASLNLARTDRGLRLVQVEPRYDIGRAERLVPRIEAFDASWWGEPRLAPSFPVVASVALAELTVPAVRFVCRADVPAHLGTEPAVLSKGA